MPKPILYPSLILLTVLAGHVIADVDLVTIPRREGTQLTIYNSQDITMVREHRLLTVKKGINRIQFSWANTLIDPTSVYVDADVEIGDAGEPRAEALDDRFLVVGRAESRLRCPPSSIRSPD